jgi:hypothetical protein
MCIWTGIRASHYRLRVGRDVESREKGENENQYTQVFHIEPWIYTSLSTFLVRLICGNWQQADSFFSDL